MSTATAAQTFSSREVMDLLDDITYRQLNHWVDRGWIPGLSTVQHGGFGQGRGHGWRWTLEQVAAARVIRDHLDQARALLADPTRCLTCPCDAWDEGGGLP